MVRLKVIHERRQNRELTGFNSKMVRLKVFDEEALVLLNNLFQFQNGSIKSKTIIGVFFFFFNVSIPKWFD